METYFKYNGVENIPLYNCSMHTSEEWTQMYGVQRPIAGFIALFYGIIVEMCYLPCMYVIMKREYIRLSCFKIMFLLGLVDMCAISVNSLSTGVLLIEGAVYCSHPTFIYIAGSVGLGLWCCACLVALVLVINRLFDIMYPNLIKTYFAGSRTTMVLLVPIAYGVYFTIMTTPILFTSRYQAWFFDPFIFVGKTMEYQNFPHTCNNIFIVIITCILYAFFCFALRRRLKVTYDARNKKSHKQIFLQSSIICLANFVAAMVYVYMQFFPVPDWVIVVGHVSWQLGHGCPAFIYLCMNKTIRNGVLKIFNLQAMNRTSAMASTMHSAKDPNRNEVTQHNSTSVY